MVSKISKTNAMRLLDKGKIEYKIHEYPNNPSFGAVEVANYLNQDSSRVFKTLVTTDNNKGYFVFCLPAEKELDLKIAAKVAGVKKIEMLKQKDLLPLTGYIHGGCSPVGMKKLFPTFINETAKIWNTIFVSGGKIGLQIEINPNTLIKIVNAKFENIIK